MCCNFQFVGPLYLWDLGLFRVKLARTEWQALSVGQAVCQSIFTPNQLLISVELLYLGMSGVAH